MFEAHEWQTLLFVPLWVFETVASADKEIDDKEELAFYHFILKRDDPLCETSLIAEMIQSLCLEFKRHHSDFHNDTRDSFTGLREALDLVVHKSPAEKKDFKQCMFILGCTIANASGGVMGFGDKVSSEEKDVLEIMSVGLHFTKHELDEVTELLKERGIHSGRLNS